MKEMRLYIYNLGVIELNAMELGKTDNSKFEEEYNKLIEKWKTYLSGRKGKRWCWHDWGRLSEDDIKSMPECSIKASISMDGKTVDAERRILDIFSTNAKKCGKCNRMEFYSNDI